MFVPWTLIYSGSVACSEFLQAWSRTLFHNTVNTKMHHFHVPISTIVLKHKFGPDYKEVKEYNIDH